MSKYMLNNGMWIRELGELYCEGNSYDSKLTLPGPAFKGGWKRPAETRNSLSYKGTFARGGSDYNPVTTPVYEQEEEGNILSLIDHELSTLDKSNSTDRVAIACLGRLKNKISKKA